MEPEYALPPAQADAVERLNDLVRAFEDHPDLAVRERAFELLQCVDTVHRAGMRRLGELLQVAGLQRRALDDPEVRLLFDMYDLGEGGERQRAVAVLEGVRPFVESQGGHLDVVKSEAGVVTVELVGGCRDRGSTTAIRETVERTLQEGLVDFVRLEVHEMKPPPPPGFVPLSSLQFRARPSPSNTERNTVAANEP